MFIHRALDEKQILTFPKDNGTERYDDDSRGARYSKTPERSHTAGIQKAVQMYYRMTAWKHVSIAILGNDLFRSRCNPHLKQVSSIRTGPHVDGILYLLQIARCDNSHDKCCFSFPYVGIYFSSLKRELATSS